MQFLCTLKVRHFRGFFFFAKTPLRLVNSHGMYFFTSLMMAPQEKSFTDDWFTFFDNSFFARPYFLKDSKCECTHADCSSSKKQFKCGRVEYETERNRRAAFASRQSLYATGCPGKWFQGNMYYMKSVGLLGTETIYNDGGRR